MTWKTRLVMRESAFNRKLTLYSYAVDSASLNGVTPASHPEEFAEVMGHAKAIFADSFTLVTVDGEP